MDYLKPWLSVGEQVRQLRDREVAMGDPGEAQVVLMRVGYYRLTGYLYPFRNAEKVVDEHGKERIQVRSGYRSGTSLQNAVDLIDFDRRLRLHVMDGIERVEVAARMRLGYVLGRRGPFAYEDPTCLERSFTAAATDLRSPAASKHVQWLEKVHARRASSDEQFVRHFRDAYEDRMPIWALTEILELGHLSRLYGGLLQPDAEEIARAFGAPTKKVFGSWLASLNYVRNVAAHHARLFNRKLQNAPGRPPRGQIPELDHLHDAADLKGGFGVYNALAVTGYLLRTIDADADADADATWTGRLAHLLREFPASTGLSVASMGVPSDWEALPLWAGERG